jgi:hypothetical protein
MRSRPQLAYQTPPPTQTHVATNTLSGVILFASRHSHQPLTSLHPTSQTTLKPKNAHDSAPRWLQVTKDLCSTVTGVLLHCRCATPRMDLDPLARANIICFCANSLLFSPSLSPLLSSPPRSHSTSMQRAHCANATSVFIPFCCTTRHVAIWWVRMGGILALHAPAFASRVDLSRDKPCACGARISTCARARATSSAARITPQLLELSQADSTHMPCVGGVSRTDAALTVLCEWSQCCMVEFAYAPLPFWV